MRSPFGNTFWSLVRTIAGALVFAALWFVLGWALSSRALGVMMACWSLLIGPLLLPVIFWLVYRWRRSGGIRRLNVRVDPVLSDAYLHQILCARGPRPRVWLHDSTEVSCLWFESSVLRGSRQELIVSSAWMKHEPAQKQHDFAVLWRSIARLSKGQRRVRSLQIACWLGALAPFELLFYAMKLVFEIIGFYDFPGPEFWLQRGCWALRGYWFGFALPQQEARILAASASSMRVRPPAIWNSLLWGVWFQVSLQGVHPLWSLLTHSEAFLH